MEFGQVLNVSGIILELQIIGLTKYWCKVLKGRKAKLKIYLENFQEIYFVEKCCDFMEFTSVYFIF